MDELSRNLSEAFLSTIDRLVSDPRDLARRLARRRSKTGLLTPRAWCLTLRASDRRFTSRIVPPPPPPGPDPYPSPPRPGIGALHISHEFLLTFTSPVDLSIGGSINDVADRLGRLPRTLRTALRRPACSLTARDRRGELGIAPGDQRGIAWARLNNVGLDSDRAKQYARGKKNLGVLPARNTSVLHDPSANRIGPALFPGYRTEWPEKFARVDEDFRQNLTLVPHGKGTYQRRAFACPACARPSRILYLPLRMMTLPRYYGVRLERSEQDDILHPPDRFACARCAQINLTPLTSNLKSWNDYVTAVSEGLLYGHEVPPPAWLATLHTKSRTGHPRKSPRPSPKSDRLKHLYLQGIPFTQIAQQLRLSYQTVRSKYYTLVPRHLRATLTPNGKRIGTPGKPIRPYTRKPTPTQTPPTPTPEACLLQQA